MAWWCAVGGIFIGIGIGVVAVFAYIGDKITSAMGQGFGLPYKKPWWKFWK